ncbi:MAG: hypothetical protein WBO04_01855 [Steroidobacteraceae bacterium]
MDTTRRLRNVGWQVVSACDKLTHRRMACVILSQAIGFTQAPAGPIHGAGAM